MVNNIKLQHNTTGKTRGSATKGDNTIYKDWKVADLISQISRKSNMKGYDGLWNTAMAEGVAGIKVGFQRAQLLEHLCGE